MSLPKNVFAEKCLCQKMSVSKNIFPIYLPKNAFAKKMAFVEKCLPKNVFAKKMAFAENNSGNQCPSSRSLVLRDQPRSRPTDEKR